MLLRMKTPATIVRIGLVALVVANLSMHYLPRTAWLSVDATDGVNGFMMGLAIATLLIGISLVSRQRSRGDGCTPR